MVEINRRDLMRWALMGGSGTAISAALAACSSSPQAAPSTTVVAATPTTTPPSVATTSAPAPATTAVPVLTTAPFDQSRPWWMQGNFAPVVDEVEAVKLTVVGAIPSELSGLYARNGSNPAIGDSPHWFFGDGMLHGMRVANGRAEWYGNKYVGTPLYQGGLGFGEGPPGGAANQANVSLTWHGGKLLTSGEVGFPFEVSTTDLSTVGVHDYAGKLTSAFTAHPKIDPVTGRLHSFGYGFVPPFLTYNVMEADGTLIHSEPVDIPRSTMIHDFAITDRDVIFWDLPVVFDLDAASKWIAEGGQGDGFPYVWSPESGARVGVMPLGGPASAIQWFDIDPCFAFHGVNAFRRGDEVVLDICRLTSMFVPYEMFAGVSSLRRWTMNTATGKLDDTIINDDNPGELPTRDPRRVGREHRYGYLVETRDNPDTVEFGGLIKHDYQTDTREIWDPGPTQHSGEWLFVPGAGAGPADDEGWLLNFIYDDATAGSEFVVVDATDIAAGPVARVALPQRVPFGFHGTWVAG